MPRGLVSSPSGGEQQTLFIEVGDTPGTMAIRIVPEQGIPRYVVIYIDPSMPSTSVEVIRDVRAGVTNWVVDVLDDRVYSVQVSEGWRGRGWERGRMEGVWVKWM